MRYGFITVDFKIIKFSNHKSYEIVSRNTTVKKIIVVKLELAKHNSLHANGEPLLKRISSHSHSHSSPILLQFCLLSGLPMVTVLLFQSEFRGKFANDTY